MIAFASWFASRPRNAAEWVARLHSGAMTAADHVALAVWLDARPEHRGTYERLSATWALAHDLRSSGVARRYLTRAPIMRRNLRARQPLMIGLGIGLAAALIALAILPAYDIHTTGPGEIQTVSLDDGSTVWLNGDSRLRVDFSAPIRRVVLERGEAFFKVAHDTDRPFVVDAESRRIVVTGTEFDVRRASDAVEVSVTDGHVKVESAIDHSDRVEAVTALSAGDDARFSADQTVPAVARGSMAQHRGAWREGKIYFDDTQLAVALDEVNRYSRTKLVLADESQQNRTMNGVFRIGDIDSVLFSLRELYHLEARRESGRIVLYKAAD
jgi:transmembrane sensor